MNLQASEIDSELGVDVGALLDKLRVHALDRDTMAIVKSDHGRTSRPAARERRQKRGACRPRMKMSSGALDSKADKKAWPQSCECKT
jgi:hypothetical protein